MGKLKLMRRRHGTGFRRVKPNRKYGNDELTPCDRIAMSRGQPRGSFQVPKLEMPVKPEPPPEPPRRRW